jgi:hypothetical protein
MGSSPARKRSASHLMMPHMLLARRASMRSANSAGLKVCVPRIRWSMLLERDTRDTKLFRGQRKEWAVRNGAGEGFYSREGSRKVGMLGTPGVPHPIFMTSAPARMDCAAHLASLKELFFSSVARIDPEESHGGWKGETHVREMPHRLR